MIFLILSKECNTQILKACQNLHLKEFKKINHFKKINNKISKINVHILILIIKINKINSKNQIILIIKLNKNKLI